MDKFVIYIGCDEVLITTERNLEAMLKEWFEEGHRDLDNYDRHFCNETAVRVLSSLQASYTPK